MTDEHDNGASLRDRAVVNDDACAAHTAGPWPWCYTGDGKRIIIGEGLVEGPNGYEVAEVYSDDCPRMVAEANARLICLSPEMLAWMADFVAQARVGFGAGDVPLRSKRINVPASFYYSAQALLAKADSAS